MSSKEPPSPGQSEKRSILQLYFKVTMSFYPTILILFLFSLLSMGGSFILPLLHRSIIDRAIIGKDYNLLKQYLLYYLVVIVTVSFLNLFRELVYTNFSNRLFERIRLILFYKFLLTPFSVFACTNEGDVTSTIIEDAKVVRNFIVEVVIAGALDVSTCLVAFFMIHYLNSTIAYLSLLFIPTYMLFYRFCNDYIKKISVLLRENISHIYAAVLQAIKGFLTIKLHNAYEYEIENFSNQLMQFSRRRLSLLMSRAGMFQATNLLLLFCSTCIWFVGGRYCIEGALTIGTLIAINDYFLRFVSPLNRIGIASTKLHANIASMYKIKMLLDNPAEQLSFDPKTSQILNSPFPDIGIADRAPRSNKSPEKIDHLAFESVSCAINGGKDVLFEDVSLSLKRGEKIGIIGRNGSGKTTLVKMAVGLVQPRQGNVLLNQINLTDWDLFSVRQKVSYVPQTPFIFSRSLKDNIAYCQRVSDESIIELAHKIHMEKLINAYDNSLYKNTSDMQLSGGEMQKICLMRYLVRKSDVYIFDETFSNIDKYSSTVIVDMLVRDKRHASIFITHDLELLSSLDHVYVIAGKSLKRVPDKSALMDFAADFSEFDDSVKTDSHESAHPRMR